MQEVFFPGKIFYTDYKIPRPILPSAASISLSIHMLHAELHAQPVACVLYGNFNIIAVVAHAVVFTRKAEPELHAAAAFAASRANNGGNAGQGAPVNGSCGV